MEYKIKIELEKFGFNINKDFINKLNQKDEVFINEQIKGFKIVILSLEKNKDLKIIDDNKENSYIYFYNKDVTKILKTYIVDDYISQGTYNKAYNVTDYDTNKKYVYRILINKIESFNILVLNFTEYFIHLFLYNQCGKNKIIKIKEIGYNKRNNLISSINEKMDGTLFYILSNNKIEHSIKISILIKAINQIVDLLEILQDKFQFMHNDLKSDNIFFKFNDNSIKDKYTPENISFFLGDFDASTIVIDGLMIGNTHLSPEKTLQKKKDIFLLINSLFYSFNTEVWRTTFFNKFPIITEIANDEKIFHSLYSYYDAKINDAYLLSNIKQIFEIKIKFEINYN